MAKKEEDSVWRSRKAALEQLRKLDPSRTKFGMEIHMIDWPLDKIQQKIEKTRIWSEWRAENDDTLEEFHL